MKEKNSILVVDDDQDCRDFATAVLSPCYQVRTVCSVDQCLEQIQQEKPDLIMLDVMMTGLSDGLDLAKSIREKPETSDIPLIMLTGVNEVYDYRTQVETSFFPHDRWLDKPVKPDVLLNAINGLLAKKTA